jgi:anti-anti-sigma factor
MCTTVLPQTRGPDDPLAREAQASETQNLLTWDIRSHGQMVFISLGGELDVATAPGLARRLAPLTETGSHFLLDLAGVQFCDCAGLSLFLRLREQVISAGGSLHLTAATAAMRRLIVVTGLQDLLPIAAGPVELITALGCDAVTAPPHPHADEIDIRHMQGSAVLAVRVAS